MPLGVWGGCSRALHVRGNASAQILSSSFGAPPGINVPCRGALQQACLTAPGHATRSFLPSVHATGKDKEWGRLPLCSYPGLFGPAGSALDWSSPDFVLTSVGTGGAESEEGRTSIAASHLHAGRPLKLLEALSENALETSDSRAAGSSEAEGSGQCCVEARPSGTEAIEGLSTCEDRQGGAAGLAEEDIKLAEAGEQARSHLGYSSHGEPDGRLRPPGSREGPEDSGRGESLLAEEGLPQGGRRKQTSSGPEVQREEAETWEGARAAGLCLSDVAASAEVCEDGFCCSLPDGLLGSMADWKEERADCREIRRRDRTAAVPVYVMLPLDSVTPSNTVNRPRAFLASLLALKSAGVEGVMMDIWWGIVEREGPRLYQWGAYAELLQAVRGAGLKLQAVMSFHQCGGNVGDHCCIPLPPWVLEEMAANPDIAYRDRSGGRNEEYISLGCDNEPLLKGRTPIEVYRDFMYSFRNHFCDYLGEVITEIQVGMGPAGELRYPSYPESNDRWRFPGIGEFQCYDKYMLAALQEEAEAVGVPLWGLGGPHDSGAYKQWPEETGFFRTGGSWNTPYGDFFLRWYSGMLLQHGDRVLSAAASVFQDCSSAVHISGKVAGIHWHYMTQSHAAELTAGYYNTVLRDGYLPLARLFAKHNATLNFTCLEMRDYEQPWWVGCSPEGLVRQVVAAAKVAGTRVAGENALPRLDTAAHEQIVRQSRLQVEGLAMDEPMASFTFLRMSERLFHPESWTNFVFFVRQMQEGRTFEAWEDEPRHSLHHHIHTTLGPLSQAAAAELMLR